MTLLNVAKWIQWQDKELKGRVSAGCIDAKKEKCLGVYHNNQAHGSLPAVCIGGLGNTRVLEKDVTLLLHWGDLPGPAEEQAQKLHQTLQRAGPVTMDGVPVCYIDPGRGPVSVGRDEKGVYEYVINLKIYYERRTDT